MKLGNARLLAYLCCDTTLQCDAPSLARCLSCSQDSHQPHQTPVAHTTELPAVPFGSCACRHCPTHRAILSALNFPGDAMTSGVGVADHYPVRQLEAKQGCIVGCATHAQSDSGDRDGPNFSLSSLANRGNNPSSSPLPSPASLHDPRFCQRPAESVHSHFPYRDHQELLWPSSVG